ncbi:MAG TPA: maleylpyruvate isomerase N-terminal domain-containing protein [Hymenobacter sp.]|jgi:uncharacterized protein (TIGR03083 family)|uniref:maleylpyruvate isomerase N-terminal domain-containing protein n=1 Tax=Hymenobacter sp. TaxID=1898978 RepID=UPI002ED902BE
MVPIDVLPLFPVLDAKLLELLGSLSPADWQRPTLARQWTVKDVAAHLLDGNLRTLSMLRDGHFAEGPEEGSYEGVLAFLNRLNADWVVAARRLSPAVLTALLAQSGTEYNAFLATLDPWAPAAFSVAWAGEAESMNWFHVAREYTEKWHHHQQIREAVGQTAPLMTPELFRPFINTLMRGVPHALRAAPAAAGAVVQVQVTSDSGGTWRAEKTPNGWQLQPASAGPADATAEVVIPPDVAWKLFTKGLSPAEALSRVQLRGNEALGHAVLRLVAVMA